jgi:hypothetical protein
LLIWPSFDTLMTTGKLQAQIQSQFPEHSFTVHQNTDYCCRGQYHTEFDFHNGGSTRVSGPRQVNFTSTSPSIPLMILRDPPGDGSSATISKGTTVCNGWGVGTTLATKLSTGVKLSLGTETVVSAGVGAEVETKTELKNELELGMSVTTKGNFNTSGEVCLTANETISTSGDGVLQGEDADVFVGGALNLLFGITDDLRFDTHMPVITISSPIWLFSPINLPLHSCIRAIRSRKWSFPIWSLSEIRLQPISGAISFSGTAI